MVITMQDKCAQVGDNPMSFSRRSALKAGGFVLGVFSLGRFASVAEAKAAGGSGLVRDDDYGIGGIFDDYVRFQFVEELDEDVTIDGTEYAKSIEYWIGCESVGGPEAAKKTFQGYLIEDDSGDNGEGGNQAVMYIYEKRPVSFDWHVFVEDEACGEEYLKVGYEPGEDGAAPEDPGNRPPDKGGDGEDGDDGDHEDDADSSHEDGDGDGGDGGADEGGDKGNSGSGGQGGNDDAGNGGAGQGGSQRENDSLTQLFSWFAKLFKI